MMNRIQNVEIIPVIKISYKEGEGTKESPARIIHQYWGTDGQLLKTVDAAKKLE